MRIGSCGAAGLEEKIAAPTRKPPSAHYTDYYTPEKRYHAAKFKVDIERFGYEFAG